jgi:IS5 family transposase
VCFNKKAGIKVPDRVRESWMYRALWRYRVGVESCISLLKRCFGLRRSTSRGEVRFKAYVWASVVAYNVLLMGRAKLE